MARKNILHFLKFDQLAPQVRGAIWLPLAFVILGILGAVGALFGYLTYPSWQSSIVLIGNLVVLLVYALSYYLFRHGRGASGAWLILFAVLSNMALLGVIYQGLGVILSVIAISISLVVIVQCISERNRVWAILLAVLVTYTIFGFDQVTEFKWSWRASPFNVQTMYIVLGVIFLLAALVMAVQFRNFFLLGKLITAFLGITLVTALLLSVVVFLMSQARLQALIGNQLKNSADTQGVIIGEELYRQLAMLETLAIDQSFVQAVQKANDSYTGTKAETDALIQQLDDEWINAPDDNDPLIQDRLNQPLSGNLRAFRNLFPDHVEVFITDRHGAIVATTNRTSDYNQADELWWQKAYGDGGGSTYIGAPEYDESSQTYAVNMAVPVRTVDREVVGVLRTTYNVSGIQSVIKTAKFGKTGAYDLVIPGQPATIITQEGETTANADVTQILGKLDEKDYLQAKYAGKDSLLSQASVRSREYSVELSILNWKLLSRQTIDEAYAPVQDQLRVNLIIIYALVSLMALVGYWLSQVLSRPIVHLTRVAEQVSAGNLTAKASVKNKDEIGSLATAFNSMTAQLKDMVSSLEQRVADRTRALATSTDVSRQLSTILDPQELVTQVVEQVQSAFNYYHAHIYLFDERQENLVMVGGTGEAGRTMLASGHKIPRGRGLVGRAADTHIPVLVADTRADPNWLPNPLLPDTRAEVAVPIEAGDRVLGVLDVQHNKVGGLGQADVDLLRSIANQVAVGLQNARSFEEAQRQTEREVLIGTISQKIRQTTSVDEALQVTVRELGKVVGAPQTRVRLGLAVPEENK